MGVRGVGRGLNILVFDYWLYANVVSGFFSRFSLTELCKSKKEKKIDSELGI